MHSDIHTDRPNVICRVADRFPTRTLPDPAPDDPNPAQPRPMRAAMRMVYDTHAFYLDEEGPAFGA